MNRSVVFIRSSSSSCLLSHCVLLRGPQPPESIWYSKDALIVAISSSYRRFWISMHSKQYGAPMVFVSGDSDFALPHSDRLSLRAFVMGTSSGPSYFSKMKAWYRASGPPQIQQVCCVQVIFSSSLANAPRCFLVTIDCSNISAW